MSNLLQQWQEEARRRQPLIGVTNPEQLDLLLSSFHAAILEEVEKRLPEEIIRVYGDNKDVRLLRNDFVVNSHVAEGFNSCRQEVIDRLNSLK